MIVEGKPLPVSCAPTSSAKKTRAPMQRSPKKSSSVSSLPGKRKKETIDFLIDSNKEGPYRPMPGSTMSFVCTRLN